jgi:transcriptional regulator with PAS, ATPase and Fis domain
MKQVFHVLERASRRGERAGARARRDGVGQGARRPRETAARALPARARGRFGAINCAALPATSWRASSSGTCAGASPAPPATTPGFFRAADRGTLFLDEIAEMPLDLQAKLLRVLETRTVIPVGGSDPVAVDVRIVAATHQSLRRAVEQGKFRADLMYRLRVVPIFLPPLRARRGTSSCSWPTWSTRSTTPASAR